MNKILEWTVAEVSQCLQQQFAGQVQHIQTHISDVFLVGDLVFKLKRPVQYDFLDFSTLARRRQACDDEVRLNRRLAADVYLGIAPLYRQGESLYFGNPIEPGESVEGNSGNMESIPDGAQLLDFAVSMRRLNQCLAEWLAAADLLAADAVVDQLAERLIAFYQAAEPARIDAGTYWQWFDKHVRENRHELLEFGKQHFDEGELRQIKALHCRHLALLELESQELRDRADGTQHRSWVVEGHGDLRPDHIYFEPGPIIIDCIEFNREYRTLDIADELAFLAVECEFLGAEAFGEKLAIAVRRALQDRPSDKLLHFYKSYRATVRAKVALLTACNQENGSTRAELLDRARKLLSLAGRHASGLNQPLVLLVRGLMGTGKSVLARGLAGLLGAEHLQTDSIRRELFQAGDRQAGYGEQLYAADKRAQVYKEMLRRAEVLVGSGVSVVLDGTFLSHDVRQQSLQIASRCQSPFMMFECRCPEQVVLDRIRNRLLNEQSLSDARPELYRQQLAEEEPVPPGFPVHPIDTTEPVERLISYVLQAIQQHQDG